MAVMIIGAHIIISSKDPDADRAFFRDILKFSAVDAGKGWLIFRLPPAEAAFHPAENNEKHELYFMCDDLKSTMASLERSKVKFEPLTEQRWGVMTELTLPGGGRIGLYQPKHAIAIDR
jgi:catechol 2,3-dioxygenase-like lactoylglutathione lyase family enzyme